MPQGDFTNRPFWLQLKMVPIKDLTCLRRQESQSFVIKVVLQMFLTHQGQDLRSHYYTGII